MMAHALLVVVDCNYCDEGQRFGMEIPLFNVSSRCVWALPTGRGLSHAEYLLHRPRRHRREIKVLSVSQIILFLHMRRKIFVTP